MRPEFPCLRSLIGPELPETFFESYWEKTYFVARQNPSSFSPFFSVRDVDTWLRTSQAFLYVTPPGEDTPFTQTHRPKSIGQSTVLTAFRKGCLLVFASMEDWPPANGLVTALRGELHAEIRAEAHLAPPDVRVFPVHVAGHDILVLQIEGERTWNLHEFELLQRNPPEKKNLKFPLEWYGRTKAPLQAEIPLQPGSVLYIPRGMPYQAQGPTAGQSLHLQLEINPLSWADFFKIGMDCALLHSQDLRRSIPPGFMEDAAICQAMRRTFEELMSQLPKLAVFEEILAATKRNRVKQQDFPADGHFTEIVDPRELGPESVLERRPDILCFAEQVTDVFKQTRSALFFGQELVAGPAHLSRANEFVREQRRFRVSEVPGLDPESQLVFARRLINEGLLRRASDSSADL